jgi:RNA polymerase sigma factor, sigma-70 family
MPDTLPHRLVALLPHLRRFAFTLTGNAADADDLVQAACERALVNAASWRVDSRLDSWLFRIMQNLWIDLRRRAERRGEHVEVGSIADAAFAVDGALAAERHADLSHIARALRQMPEMQRHVLMLTCVRGLTHQECAGLLNIPIGTVMSRLARARENLHRRLDTP